MSIFECSGCGCVENTALAPGWWDNNKLCSECNPEIGKWHGVFEKKSAAGYFLGNDGFLYSKTDNLDWRKEHQGFSIVKKL